MMVERWVVVCLEHHRHMIKSPCVMEQCRLRDAYAEDLSLPRQLHGVPDSLRAWWDRVDPKELEKSTVRSGRTELLGHLCRRLEKCSRVLDLGCGCGLLAKEALKCNRVSLFFNPSQPHKRHHPYRPLCSELHIHVLPLAPGVARPHATATHFTRSAPTHSPTHMELAVRCVLLLYSEEKPL